MGQCRKQKKVAGNRLSGVQDGKEEVSERGKERERERGGGGEKDEF